MHDGRYSVVVTVQTSTRTLAPWQQAAKGAGLVDAQGNITATIFAEMTALAVKHNAINLGQGFPDEDGPQSMLDTAIAAIQHGENQYPPGRGEAVLRSAIAHHQQRFYGLDIDPDTEVLVTTGATEAISSTLLAFVEAGDEVVVFEPFYDEYAALVGLTGATLVPVSLTLPNFQPDLDVLRAAVTDHTRLIIVNDPHNPTGAVFSSEVRSEIVKLATAHDAYIVTDEVYEHAMFDGRIHTPIATDQAARDRTISISSAAKTFRVTGWKIGWITAPAPLIDAILAVKQYLTFTTGAPFQPAIAHALELDDSYFDEFASDLEHKRDVLVEGLQAAGFSPFPSAGGYYVVVDGNDIGYADAAELCRALPATAGVAAVPITAFTKDPAPYRSLVRFAFCKRLDVLREAATRLSNFAA